METNERYNLTESCIFRKELLRWSLIRSTSLDWLIIVNLHPVRQYFTDLLFDSLFVCFFVPIETFSLIWWRHHCRCRAAFDVCSALMAIEQSGFLACHTKGDTGHLLIWSYPRTRDTRLLQSVWQCSNVTVTSSFNYLGVSFLEIDPRFPEENDLPLSHSGGLI